MLAVKELMDRQPVKRTPNESGYKGKLRDASHATYKTGGGVENRLKRQDIIRGKANIKGNL